MDHMRGRYGRCYRSFVDGVTWSKVCRNACRCGRKTQKWRFYTQVLTCSSKVRQGDGKARFHESITGDEVENDEFVKFAN